MESADLTGAVVADPRAPLLAGIRGPGGYGKTALLGTLARCYQRADVPVVGIREVLADASDYRHAAVLVDDAHRLTGDQLARLCALAKAERQRLVVAYRPWPRPAALTELAGLLDRARPSLLLQPLDAADVVERSTALLGSGLSHELGGKIVAQTGGVPRYVDRVLRALGQTHRGRSATGATLDLPAAALAQFQSELDTLEPRIYRLLLGKSVAAGLPTELVATYLGLDADTAFELMDGARATGMLDRDGVLLPVVHRAFAALSPVEQKLTLQRQLIDAQRQRGGPLLPLVRPLLGTAVGGQAIAAAFETAGDEALRDSPRVAGELYTAAVRAGTPAVTVAARQAQAACMCGDFDAALRLADGVIAGTDGPDRARAAEIAGTVLAHRGLLGSSAELYRWSGSAAGRAFAVIGLLGTGRRGEAAKILAEDVNSGPPVLLTTAAIQMANGVYQSIVDTSVVALSTLTRAAAMLEPVGHAEPLPDTPAALAALVALHCGEFAVADSVLERAIDAGLGGGLAKRRHQLLRAWGALLSGDTGLARSQLATATAMPGAPEPRDWLLATALEAGIARRDSDLGALRAAWERAREAVVRHPADLFSLLPLGELAVTAARLGEQDRLIPHLSEADLLLRQLDNPALWASMLHWNRLHAAILGDEITAAEEQADGLAAAADRDPYIAVLAAGARSWLNVLTGTIDPAEVESAARGLHRVGLRWDGPRLAGQAAIRTSDRKAMLRLLDCARALQGKTTRENAEEQPSEQPGAGRGEATGQTPGALSDREREVAELIVDGLTYKEVGQRLFISAKTVEYHVARMRQRLGCSSRSDLLEQLRYLVTSRAAS